MPLGSCRIIAADNRCASGIRAALPELIVIYEPLPITTQARHYTTRGSIITAAWPLGLGRPVLIHIFYLQKRKSPDVSARAFLFFMPPLKVKAAYQSRLKYDAFNPVLQDLSLNLSPFVVNVIA